MINKNIIYIFIVAFVMALSGYSIYFAFGNNYSVGSCVENLEDGYIWYISDYSFGKYIVMGWQGNAWGNPVSFNKNTLERYNSNKERLYFTTECPEYNVQ